MSTRVHDGGGRDLTRDAERSCRLDPRLVRSRVRLLDAATDLLVEGGAGAVTVDAVSERSGVAKSTMYRHFPSRTKLLVEVLSNHVPKLDIELPPGSFEDAVRALVRTVAAAMTDPDWSRILPSLLLLETTLPDVHALTDRERSSLLDRVRIVIARGASEGRLAPETDVATTMHLLIGPLVLATLDDHRHRLADLVDEISDRYIASCTQTHVDDVGP